MTKPIVLWHGARAWSGPPVIHPAKKGRLEYGPGIYLTTSLATAKKYAKGGGVIMRFEVDPRVRWIEGAVLPVEPMIKLVASLRGSGAKKARVVADILRSAVRLAPRLGVGRTHASVLVNLLVNDDLLTGDNGPKVARFLTEHDIHASLQEKSGDEDWVVIFDPSKILSWRRATPEEYHATQDHPRVPRGGGGAKSKSKVARS